MRVLVTGGAGFIGWRVVRALMARQIPVVVADWNIDDSLRSRFEPSGLVQFTSCDISDYHNLAAVFHRFPDITHAIHLAYVMSAESEANPLLAARVNVVGLVHLLEAATMHRLSRVVITSSEAVYGASQQLFGDRPIGELEYCGPNDHFYTYGVMKVLNEFMTEKYVRNNGLSAVCVRPPLVFGYGRKRGSLLWAEDFISLPAAGKPAKLPFPSSNRDCWLYVDDCAEQLVRLALKPELQHFVYNSGGHSVSAGEFAELVRGFLPDAEISFSEDKPCTKLVDNLDGSRLQHEIGFEPRPLREGILAHINEYRTASGLSAIEDVAVPTT